MKKAVILLLLVVLGVFGMLVGLRERRFQVRFTQDQIDGTLGEHFPMTKTHWMIFELTYRNPVAELLEEENRVRVGMDAVLSLPSGSGRREYTGGATVTTSVRYDPETYAFYLSDLAMERLEIDGIPRQYTDRASQLALLAAQEVVESIRVYQIEGADTQSRVARMVLKDVRVQGQTVVVSFGL